MKRAAIAISIVVLVCCAGSLHAEEPVVVGVTYSPKQSEYLDQDWKKTYIEILDCGFNAIRLGAYWNEIEKEPGVYDFNVLDLSLIHI